MAFCTKWRWCLDRNKEYFSITGSYSFSLSIICVHQPVGFVFQADVQYNSKAKKFFSADHFYSPQSKPNLFILRASFIFLGDSLGGKALDSRLDGRPT